MLSETPHRIEPALLEEGIPPVLLDLTAEISTVSAKLEKQLHPNTAAGLASMVRIMNCYYSNLIEGHTTRPRDIESALQNPVPAPRSTPSTLQIENAIEGNATGTASMRDLLVEARAHVKVQEKIDAAYLAGDAPEPAAAQYIKWLHREFYADASPDMLTVSGGGKKFRFEPGHWRTHSEEDVAVGRHVPPSSAVVAEFMSYFESRYNLGRLGKGARILAIPAAHHRFNYIHPFPDGNGRVSRLMSHAMGHAAGIGAHGLWSVSRGLARGLESRSDYKRMMDHADMPRQGDLDGRGNLSLRALVAFSEWFLKVCLDQIRFMADLFELETLAVRLVKYVRQSAVLKPEAALLLEEALIRGSFERGAITRITGLPERSARRVLAETIEDGMLASTTPKGALFLRFPVKSQDVLFPRLFPEA